MPELSVGSTFAGELRVVRPLARGGMGVVYEVEQLSTGRRRALKIMHGLLVGDDKSRERFAQEARIGAAIASDHVVEVIDAGVDEASGMPWLVMELLEGETLSARVASGPMTRAMACELLEQLGHALEATHRAGVVHRDLKPDNVFLASPRTPGLPFTLKLLDLGIARLVQQAHATTQAVGSPAWMAPEQADALPVTPATDVWALGLVAFYALTGRPYWKHAQREGTTLSALLTEILVEPLVPASERAKQLGRPGLLDPAFDRWLARALARDPKERFPSAGEATRALVASLRGEEPMALSQTAPSLAPRPRPAPAKGAPWAMIGIGIGLGGLVLMALIVSALLLHLLSR